MKTSANNPRSRRRGLEPTPSASINTSIAGEGAGASSNVSIDELATILGLLSNHTRLRILLCLTGRRELHVGELCQRLQMSQPAVSHHLALLRAAQLIDYRRVGKRNFYQFVPRRIEKSLKPLLAHMLDGGMV